MICLLQKIAIFSDSVCKNMVCVSALPSLVRELCVNQHHKNEMQENYLCLHKDAGFIGCHCKTLQ